MLKLDWPAAEKRAASSFRPLPDRKPTNPDNARYAVAVFVLATCAAILMAAFFIGRATVIGKATAIADAAVEEATKAQTLANAFKTERDDWKLKSEDASDTIEALESELTSATDAAELWEARALDSSSTAAAVKEDNEALKRDIARIQQQKREVKPETGATTTVASTGGTWSKSQVASTLTAAASKYGLTADQTAWVVATGTRIAYRESTYKVAVVNGSGHAGLFQFSSSWGTLAERTDPVWSCYRFVRVYAEGGESAIRRHWRATV